MKKPFIEVQHGGHKISVVNTFNNCVLMIDGKQVDSYKGAIAFSFTLRGKADLNIIRAEFKLKMVGGVMSIFYNDNLLVKKFHF